MNSTTHDTTENLDEMSEQRELVRSLARVGAAWARYGLGVARISVVTSARTLDVAAAALGTLAEEFGRFERDKPERGAEPIDATGETAAD
jgi:hypothetical protein